MAHWLEEAEREGQGRESKSNSPSFLDRKMRIEKNYNAHAKEYNTFIKTIDKLVKRVNALPLEKKDPFGNIDSKSKESKLLNHMHVLKSSLRFQQKVYRGSFWDLLKPKHLKHVRVILITVSSQFGKIGLDVRDEALLKEKIVVDDELVKEKKKFQDEDRFHEYMNWDIKDLNEELALKIIDWLAYKAEVYELPFVKINKIEEDTE